MRTQIQVLSEDDKAQVHERTLKVLSTVGLRCDTAEGRRILASAGADSDAPGGEAPRQKEQDGKQHPPRRASPRGAEFKKCKNECAAHGWSVVCVIRQRSSHARRRRRGFRP